MRKLTLSLIAGAAALAAGSVAYAQSAPAPAAPQAAMTRAAAEQRAARMFDRLDANHDGKLDQADRDARLKARFDRADTNHDGQVSYAEFTAARANFAEARKNRIAERNDTASARAGGSEPRADGPRMAMRRFAARRGALRMALAGKDGSVTKDAFVAAVLQRFDRLDANHDGTVTRDEAKAERDNMRQQWQSRRESRTG